VRVGHPFNAAIYLSQFSVAAVGHPCQPAHPPPASIVLIKRAARRGRHANRLGYYFWVARLHSEIRRYSATIPLASWRDILFERRPLQAPALIKSWQRKRASWRSLHSSWDRSLFNWNSQASPVFMISRVYIFSWLNYQNYFTPTHARAHTCHTNHTFLQSLLVSRIKVLPNRVALNYTTRMWRAQKQACIGACVAKSGGYTYRRRWSETLKCTPHVCNMNFIARGVYDVDDVRRIWWVSVSRDTIACEHAGSKS